MRYARLVLLSTLSAFALTASTTSPAFGPSTTDIGLLKPHGIWQVGSVNAKNASYCAMVGQFDKEVSLAFARSPSGFGSLAINFPGEILETGNPYEVTLQVDDLEARRYNIRASSARSLIVQIGQDEDFYSSLGSNGTLHIGLPNVDVKFDLKKFSGSYISLISCADKLNQHEGPRTAAMPVTPVEKTPLPDGKAVETKTAELKPVELKAPPGVVPAPAVKTAAKPSPAVPAVTIVAAAQKKTDTAPHEKGLAVAEAKAAPASVAVSAPAPAHVPDITWSTADKKDQANIAAASQLTHENTNVNEQNLELKGKLAQSAIDQTELTNNVNLLKSEKYDLQSKLDMKDKQAKLLEAALSAKDRDLSSVRSLSNGDSKTLVEAQAELAALKRDHAAQISELQSKLAERTAQYDTLQKQFTDGGETRRTAETRASQSQIELETLRQRLAQAQAQIASTESQKSDLATQVEFQGQQSKTLLQRVQEQLSKATQQISLLESQMTSVAMQRDDLASQLDAEANKNKALQASLEVKERELAYQSGPKTAPASERSNTNISSSEKSMMPAITSPQTVAQDYAPSAPVLKASAAGVRSASGAAEDNWETVVVQ